MSYDLVVRGGLVVTADDEYEADVAVADGVIAAIGSGLRGRREIDARGRYVIPGAVDGHVHMRTERPQARYDDDWDSGTIAAAFGGTTTMVDQAQVEPPMTLTDGVAKRLAEAEGKAVIDYGLHVNLREAERARLGELERLFARGFPSVKLYMTYDGYKVPDDIILGVMQEVARLGGLVIVHAENDILIAELMRQHALAGRDSVRDHAEARPAVFEGEAVHRTLAMAEYAGARTLIYHVTAKQALREIAYAKGRGQEVYGEGCLPYLMLDDSALDDPVRGGAFDISPPLRTEEHRLALWRALGSGTLDIVSTDHGPRRLIRNADGSTSYPVGTSGIEVRLALAHHVGVRDGWFSRQRWVDLCCTTPARLFGLQRKGRILPGLDADLVVFDPERRLRLTHENLHSNIDHATYPDVEVRGFPAVTISRGDVIVEDGELYAEPGRGRLVERRYPA
jgi:dihydropyrimidinase